MGAFISLLDLYDDWFPPIHGVGNSSILRPLIWVTTSFLPVILMPIGIVFLVGSSIDYLPETWGIIVFLVSLLAFIPACLWWYKYVVDYIYFSPEIIGRLTGIGTVLTPVIFTWLYYGITSDLTVTSVNWGKVGLIYAVSALVIYFLGRLHRKSRSKQTADASSAIYKMVVEKVVSHFSGIVVPGWVKMHFRYFDQGIVTWLFLLFLPGLLFMIILSALWIMFIGATDSIIDWSSIPALNEFSIFGFIAFSYTAWGLVVYAIERNRIVRISILTSVFVILSGLSMFFYFVEEQEHFSATLPEIIFVNLFMVILIGLGCLTANNAVRNNQSESLDLGILGPDVLELVKTNPNDESVDDSDTAKTPDKDV